MIFWGTGARARSSSRARSGSGRSLGFFRLQVLLQVGRGLHFLALGDVAPGDEHPFFSARRPAIPLEAPVRSVAAPKREFDRSRFDDQARIYEHQRSGLLARIDEPGERFPQQACAGVSEDLFPGSIQILEPQIERDDSQQERGFLDDPVLSPAPEIVNRSLWL